jgi:hypothetical protein
MPIPGRSVDKEFFNFGPINRRCSQPKLALSAGLLIAGRVRALPQRITQGTYLLPRSVPTTGYRPMSVVRTRRPSTGRVYIVRLARTLRLQSGTRDNKLLTVLYFWAHGLKLLCAPHRIPGCEIRPHRLSSDQSPHGVSPFFADTGGRK